MSTEFEAPAAPPLLHTVVGAAARLSVGRTTVYELIKTGDLRTVHIGTKQLVPESECESLVERLIAREHGPAGDPSQIRSLS